jgi:IMP dehydrogenase
LSPRGEEDAGFRIHRNLEPDVEAKRLLHKYRMERLIVVDDHYKCMGLITVNEMEKAVHCVG